MNKTLIMFAAAASALIGLAAPTASAASAIIEQAKNSCVVGEQADGYLGVVDGANASEEVRREVRSVNQQRKSAYASLAQRNGVTIEVTAALTAEKLINQATSGQCVRDANGAWIQL